MATSKLTQEERDILTGLQEILAGHGDVVTPEAMKARRRGRPPLPAVKVGVKIRLDADLLGVLRASGAGWQTKINDLLRREFMSPKTTAQMIYVHAVALAKPETRPLLMESDSSNFSDFFQIHALEGDRYHA